MKKRHEERLESLSLALGAQRACLYVERAHYYARGRITMREGALLCERAHYCARGRITVREGALLCFARGCITMLEGC